MLLLDRTFFPSDLAFETTPFDNLVRTLTEGRSAERSGAYWPVSDVHESKAGFHISVEMPGIAPEDINVTFEGDVLTVSGERKLEKEVEGTYRRESKFGKYARSYVLPKTADGANVKASYKYGILSLDVPLKEEAKPRKVEIQVTT